MECKYALTTFGIPQQALPVSNEGDLFVDQHSIWIETRRTLEAQRRKQEIEQDLSEHTDRTDRSILDLSLRTTSPGREEIVSQQYASVPRTNGGDITFNVNDVLFGRGKNVVAYEGNSMFRNLVAHQADAFENASREEKTQIMETIVQQIKASGGRFLRRDESGGWEEVDHLTARKKVDHLTARKKVAHAFRNRRKLPHGSPKEVM